MASARIEDNSRRYEPVGRSATDQAEDYGRVAQVKCPGWVLVTAGAEERVIREAQVSVFGPAES